MSAFIVGKEHIDYLVDIAAASRYGVNYWPEGYGKGRKLDPRIDCNEIGRLLWTENVKSVSYHYPNEAPGHWPGPIDLDWETITLYQHQYTGTWMPMTAVQGLKALRCYVYQSCEHPEWETSAAKEFCDTLQLDLIRRLDGYEKADWEVPSRPERRRAA